MNVFRQRTVSGNWLGHSVHIHSRGKNVRLTLLRSANLAGIYDSRPPAREGEWRYNISLHIYNHAFVWLWDRDSLTNPYNI